MQPFSYVPCIRQRHGVSNNDEEQTVRRGFSMKEFPFSVIATANVQSDDTQKI